MGAPISSSVHLAGFPLPHDAVETQSLITMMPTTIHMAGACMIRKLALSWHKFATEHRMQLFLSQASQRRR